MYFKSAPLPIAIRNHILYILNNTGYVCVCTHEQGIGGDGDGSCRG